MNSIQERNTRLFEFFERIEELLTENVEVINKMLVSTKENSEILEDIYS